MMWADLLIACGTPGYNRLDNEPEFMATATKELDQLARLLAARA